jgi:hypothetical protein
MGNQSDRHPPSNERMMNRQWTSPLSTKFKFTFAPLHVACDSVGAEREVSTVGGLDIDFGRADDSKEVVVFKRPRGEWHPRRSNPFINQSIQNDIVRISNRCGQIIGRRLYSHPYHFSGRRDSAILYLSERMENVRVHGLLCLKWHLFFDYFKMKWRNL